ncbi:hypothetical protein [Methylobacterium gregans]|uniref:hypothetical protein n=1 Tax=Methylobacterium gregans TaxID=374424 RepID=UPI0024E0F751|nr:hypothetical protein [Methylobacterium gregans]MDQ0521850.1 hypothetical protein [Methylobacterium gregans]
MLDATLDPAILGWPDERARAGSRVRETIRNDGTGFRRRSPAAARIHRRLRRHEHLDGLLAQRRDLRRPAPILGTILVEKAGGAWWPLALPFSAIAAISPVSVLALRGPRERQMMRTA